MSIPKFEQLNMDGEISSLLSTVFESTIPTPPNSITDFSIVPKRDDVTNAGKIFLRPNQILTPYASLEKYRDVQFRLMMEDFMSPLRHAILNMLNPDNAIQGDPSESAINIYEKVMFQSRKGLIFHAGLIPECPTSWRYYRVSFKRIFGIQWETRLKPGSLVYLWAKRSKDSSMPGGFELIPATVVGMM